jgi:hypothetical protein
VTSPATPPPASKRAAARQAEEHPIEKGVLTLVCVVTIAFLAFQIATFGYGRDQGIYAMVGRLVLAGKMPYRDAWDFKPPGVFLIYALSRAIFGGGQHGIRLVEVAGLVAQTLAMMRITRRWWGEARIGLMGGAIAALAHAQLDFWHTAQPETFGGMITIFALAALGPVMTEPRLAEAPDRDSRRRLLIAGALFGFAGLLKPPLAGGGAVVAAALGLRVLAARECKLDRASMAAAFRPALYVVLGGAAPIALCVLWFVARGAYGDLKFVLFVFTPYYTKLSWVGETLTGMVYWGFTEWLLTYCSVVSVGVILAASFPRRPRERFGVRVVAAIIAVHIAGVIMQGKFFPYHYGATWPLTALLGGLGFHRVWTLFGRIGPARAPLFLSVVIFVAFGRTATKDVEDSFLVRCKKRVAIFTHSPRDVAAIDRLASVADVNAAANREVAGFLRARVPADRKVFVWGFEPVIYDLADREPATRYLYDVPQRVAWAKARERGILMRDLEEGRPAAIVVERHDVFPMVTGDAIDSADTLKDFWALREMLRTRYVLATTIEDFDIYLERS